MDLLQLQEELHIVIQITKQQLDLITELRTWLGRELRSLSSRAGETDPHQQNFRERRTSRVRLLPQAYWGLTRQHGATRQADPISQLLENLNREYNDMFDLRESTSSVIERTIKLVNLRLEDHGKAILVFTVVTVIFLPLSFISSYFGMNFADIRDMEERHGFFWIVGKCYFSSKKTMEGLTAGSGFRDNRCRSFISSSSIFWRPNPRPISGLERE